MSVQEIPGSIRPSPKLFPSGGAHRREIPNFQPDTALHIQHRGEQLSQLLFQPAVIYDFAALKCCAQDSDLRRNNFVVRSRTFKKQCRTCAVARWFREKDRKSVV